MGLFADLGAKLFGGDSGIIGSATKAAEDIKTMVTDRLPPEQRAEFEQKQREIMASLAKAQSAVNKVEAKHRSIFVAGWRPMIGWVAGLTLLYNELVRQIAMDFFGASLAPVNDSMIGKIVLGLLGLGYMGLRTREKEKGVNGRH